MRLSVTVPVHNEIQNIPVFFQRARTVLDSIEGLSGWEMVFVNNGSTDGTLEVLHEIRTGDGRVRVVSLSRNFGYHASVSAGLRHGNGDLYAIIDVDGEDPPELLARFFGEIQNGAQIAYGIRSQRPESNVITSMRRLFYFLNKTVADAEIIMWMSEFCMMERTVRDAILAPKTTYPFLRAELGYVGFRRVGIQYRREMRMFGESHYRLFQMTRFAIGGILSSSTFPLRFVLYLAAVLAVAFPVVTVTTDMSLERAAALALITCFYFLLISIPILALYLARTYKNGVARPVFVVDEKNSRL